jgi:putative peptidoglycan lipid II flippase
MSLANLVGAAVALFPLHLRLSGVDGARVVGTHLRLLLAAAVAAGGGWVGGSVGHAVAGEGRTGSAVALVLGAAVLIPLYLGAARALRVRELDALLRPITARLRRPA